LEIIEKNGFEPIKAKIEKRLLYIGEEVKIYDPTLTTVLNSGTFVGLDNYGHALLSISSGRLRKD
jgi:biotin-(acetyl-CoA carboxylase) ligase